MISTHGSSVNSTCIAKGCFWLFTVIFTSFWCKSGNNDESLGATLVRRSLICRPSTFSGLLSVASTTSPSITTDTTLPSSIHL